jgi:hypothetical protein
MNQRNDVWAPFMWQHHVVPGPLPVAVEAHEHAMQARQPTDVFVTRLEAALPKLAGALRNLKKGLRDRDLEGVLSARSRLRPLVTQVRVAEAALYPGMPLMPDWKQYSRCIRNHYAVYTNVGRALEALAWGQAVDDQLEMRRLGDWPIYCGPRLRDWGRQFWPQPLSLLRSYQERHAVARLRGKAKQQLSRQDALSSPSAAASRELVGCPAQAQLHRRAQLQAENVYHNLRARRLSLWALLGRDGSLRHAVYQVRVTLQALGCASDALPARMSQFFLGGGDPGENRRAWLHHLDAWCTAQAAQTPFCHSQTIFAELAPCAA